jgi:hypothetical protein
MQRESRVSQLLRDARASVGGATRPETPRETLRALSQSRGGSRSSLISAAEPLGASLGMTRSGSFSSDPARKMPLRGRPMPAGLPLGAAAAPPPADAAELPSILDELAQCLAVGRVDANGAALIAPYLRHDETSVRARCTAVLLRTDDAAVRRLAVECAYELCRDGSVAAVRAEPILDPLVMWLRDTAAAAPSHVTVRATGALRHASGDAGAEKALVTHGVLPLLHETLQLLAARRGGGRLEYDDDVAAHIVATLRNLSVEYAHLVTKQKTDVLLATAVLQAYADHTEIALSTVCALAKVVTPAADGDAEPGAAPNKALLALRANLPCVNALAATIVANADVPLVVSRAALVLSLVLDGDDGAQYHFVRKAGSAVADTAAVAVRYLGAAAPQHDAPRSLLRVLANATCNSKGGKLLAAGSLPLELAAFVGRCDMDAAPDTALLALTALANLTFYISDSAGDAVDALLAALLPPLAALLFHTNVEGTVEAARVLGNLSGLAAGRAAIAAHRVDEIVAALLAHYDDRVVYNCLGVVTNLSGDAEWAAAQDVAVARDLTASVAALAQRDTAEIAELAGHTLHHLHQR